LVCARCREIAADVAASSLLLSARRLLLISIIRDSADVSKIEKLSPKKYNASLIDRIELMTKTLTSRNTGTPGTHGGVRQNRA